LHPGFDVNLAISRVGVVIVVVLVVVLSVIPALLVAPTRLRQRSPRITAGSRAGGALASAGAPTGREHRCANGARTRTRADLGAGAIHDHQRGSSALR
jgi:hypothetical protein